MSDLANTLSTVFVALVVLYVSTLIVLSTFRRLMR